MVTARVWAGLGNQMFQYAAAYALARRLNTEVYLDTSRYASEKSRSFELQNFHIQAKIIEPQNVSKVIRFYQKGKVNRQLRKADIRLLPCGGGTRYLLETCEELLPEYFALKRGNVYLDGYFQSEEYFKQYRGELLEQFQPINSPGGVCIRGRDYKMQQRGGSCAQRGFSHRHASVPLSSAGGLLS